jgi:hypothetical protein
MGQPLTDDNKRKNDGQGIRTQMKKRRLRNAAASMLINRKVALIMILQVDDVRAFSSRESPAHAKEHHHWLHHQQATATKFAPLETGILPAKTCA